jgi:hypothetical protein
MSDGRMIKAIMWNRTMVDCVKPLQTAKITWVQDRILTLGLLNEQEEYYTLEHNCSLHALIYKSVHQ